MSKTALSTSARPKRRFPRARTLLLCLFALAVVALVLGVWFWVEQQAGGKLRKAEQQADRLDPSWRLRDLIASRVPVADEENSAIAVANIVRLIPVGWRIPPKRFAGQDAPPGSPPIVQELSLIHI